MTRCDTVKFHGFSISLSTPTSVKSSFLCIIVSSLHPLRFAQSVSSKSSTSTVPCWFLPIHYCLLPPSPSLCTICLFQVIRIYSSLLVPPDPLLSPPSMLFPLHNLDLALPSHPHLLFPAGSSRSIIVSSLHPLPFAQSVSSKSSTSTLPCWFLPIHYCLLPPSSSLCTVCLFQVIRIYSSLLVPPDPLLSPPSIPFPSHPLPSHSLCTSPLLSPPSILFPLHSLSLPSHPHLLFPAGSSRPLSPPSIPFPSHNLSLPSHPHLLFPAGSSRSIIVSSLHPLPFAQVIHIYSSLLVPPDPLLSPPSILFPLHSLSLPSHPHLLFPAGSSRSIIVSSLNPLPLAQSVSSKSSTSTLPCWFLPIHYCLLPPSPSLCTSHPHLLFPAGSSRSIIVSFLHPLPFAQSVSSKPSTSTVPFW